MAFSGFCTVEREGGEDNVGSAVFRAEHPEKFASLTSLPPENDTRGNREYKLQLLSKSPLRLKQVGLNTVEKEKRRISSSSDCVKHLQRSSRAHCCDFLSARVPPYWTGFCLISRCIRRSQPDVPREADVEVANRERCFDVSSQLLF